MSKVAVVTGGSAGIGAAVVETLAGAGYRVVALGRDEARLSAVAERVDGEVWPVVCDLRDEATIRATFATIAERWTGVDVLVNSAGIGPGSSLVEGTYAEWRATLEVNVLAVALCSQLAVEQMRARGGRGQIVHISSMSGHRVTTWSGMYAASKFAVQAMAEGLRRELRELDTDIRVATISPGTVATRFGLAPDEPDKERPFAMLQPADVAASVLHILEAPEHVHIGDVQMRPTRQLV